PTSTRHGKYTLSLHDALPISSGAIDAMNRRERLEKTIAGEETDRTPVGLWRHFPGDDQRVADFARSVVEFQRTYDWDFVKVTPADRKSTRLHSSHVKISYAVF